MALLGGVSLLEGYGLVRGSVQQWEQALRFFRLRIPPRVSVDSQLQHYTCLYAAMLPLHDHSGLNP